MCDGRPLRVDLKRVAEKTIHAARAEAFCLYVQNLKSWDNGETRQVWGILNYVRVTHKTAADGAAGRCSTDLRSTLSLSPAAWEEGRYVDDPHACWPLKSTVSVAWDELMGQR